MEPNPGLPNRQRVPPYRYRIRGVRYEGHGADNPNPAVEAVVEEFPYLPFSREEDFVAVARPSTSESNTSTLTRAHIMASLDWLGKHGMAPIKTDNLETTMKTPKIEEPKSPYRLAASTMESHREPSQRVQRMTTTETHKRSSKPVPLAVTHENHGSPSKSLQSTTYDQPAATTETHRDPNHSVQPVTTAEPYRKSSKRGYERRPGSPALVTSTSSSSTNGPGPSQVKEISAPVPGPDQELCDASEAKLQDVAKIGQEDVNLSDSNGDASIWHFTDSGSGGDEPYQAVDPASGCTSFPVPAQEFCGGSEAEVKDLEKLGEEDIYWPDSDTDASILYVNDSSSGDDDETFQAVDPARVRFNLGNHSSDTQQKVIPLVFAQHGEVPKYPKGGRNGKSYMSKILDVTGPDNFCISLQHRKSAKEFLEDELKNHYKRIQWNKDYGIPDLELLTHGQVIVCYLDEHWNRAQIVCGLSGSEDIDGKSYKVLLLDEGVEIEVLLDDIRYMYRSFLNYSVNGIKCALYKKDPLKPWSIGAAKRFRDVVQDGALVNLKYIHTDPNDPRTWIVSFKINIEGGSKYDKRYVDIGSEIRTHERRANIISMYKPMTSNTDDEADVDSLFEEPYVRRPQYKTTFNFRLPHTSD